MNNLRGNKTKKPIIVSWKKHFKHKRENDRLNPRGFTPKTIIRKQGQSSSLTTKALDQ